MRNNYYGTTCIMPIRQSFFVAFSTSASSLMRSSSIKAPILNRNLTAEHKISVGNLPNIPVVAFLRSSSSSPFNNRKRSISLEAPLKRPPDLAIQRLSLKNGSRPKKSVSWADEQGGLLVSIIEESERKNDDLEKDISTNPYPTEKEDDDVFDTSHDENCLATDKNGAQQSSQLLPKWSLTFRPPASNFSLFKRLLEANRLCLETAYLDVQNDSSTHLCGTVKVQNLCFEKRVFLRLTRDNWATFDDILCTFCDRKPGAREGKSPDAAAALMPFRPLNYLAYAPKRKDSAEMNLPGNYDTFSFDVLLNGQGYASFAQNGDNKPEIVDLSSNSPSSPGGVVDTVQFCIGYRAGTNVEFWDNNQGSNYRVITLDRSPDHEPPQPPTPMKSCKVPKNGGFGELKNGAGERRQHFFGDDFTESILSDRQRKSTENSGEAYSPILTSPPSVFNQAG